MQILAVSDVVLFRTRAERLHSDLFSFLGNASKAYIKYFADALKKMENESSNSEPLNQVCKIVGSLSYYWTFYQDSVCNLGPAVIIFHETRYTEPLKTSAGENNSPEEQLRKRFGQLGFDLNAFSTLRWVNLWLQNSFLSVNAW